MERFPLRRLYPGEARRGNCQRGIRVAPQANHIGESIMQSRITAAFVAALLGVSVLGASLAAAQTNVPPNVAANSAKPVDNIMIEKIIATLGHKGITGITDIRSSGDGFQVAAMKDTQPVQVWVDPASGEIKVQNR
jgi:hypothetical protein